jgi:hypothetical protein
MTSRNTSTPSGSFDEEDIESGLIRIGSWRNETNNTPLPSTRTLGSTVDSRLSETQGNGPVSDKRNFG